MAVEMIELYDSRGGQEGDKPTAELRYVVTGTNDEGTVRTTVLGGSPSVHQGLRRTSFQFIPEGGEPGKEVWRITVYYEDPAEDNYTFETSGGSEHITQSLATVASYPAPGFTAPNFRNAIGVNGDDIAGTDKTVPIFNFSESHRFASEVVTQEYKLTLFRLTDA